MVADEVEHHQPLLTLRYAKAAAELLQEETPDSVGRQHQDGALDLAPIPRERSTRKIAAATLRVVPVLPPRCESEWLDTAACAPRIPCERNDHAHSPPTTSGPAGKEPGISGSRWFLPAAQGTRSTFTPQVVQLTLRMA